MKEIGDIFRKKDPSTSDKKDDIGGEINSMDICSKATDQTKVYPVARPDHCPHVHKKHCVCDIPAIFPVKFCPCL